MISYVTLFQSGFEQECILLPKPDWKDSWVGQQHLSLVSLYSVDATETDDTLGGGLKIELFCNSLLHIP